MKKENKFNVNFKEVLCDGQQINKILNHIDQDQFETEETLSTYEKNGNRRGIIFTAKEAETGEMQKIIMDAIDGEPSLNQIRDLTYNIGADCNKRIILYTLKNTGKHKNKYRHEKEMVRKFARNNNVCRVETLIINVSLSSDNTCKYKIEECIDINDWTTFKRLPSKLEFDKAVFKVFYIQTDWFEGYEHVEHMDDFEGWFSGTYWCLDLPGISCRYPVWEEDGLFAQAVSISTQGKQQLQSIKKNKNLKEMFINRETFFEKDLQGDFTLSIKLWDRPLSYFTKSSSEDKKRIAEFLRTLDGLISEFWQLCPGKEGDCSYIKKYLAIPEDAFKVLEEKI
jgi:hypothetical protein